MAELTGWLADSPSEALEMNRWLREQVLGVIRNLGGWAGDTVDCIDYIDVEPPTDDWLGENSALLTRLDEFDSQPASLEQLPPTQTAPPCFISRTPAPPG